MRGGLEGGAMGTECSGGGRGSMAFNLWGGGKRQPPPAPFLSHRRNLGKSGLRVSCLGRGEGGGGGGHEK